MSAEAWERIHATHVSTCGTCSDKPHFDKYGLCPKGRELWMDFVSMRLKELGRV